MKSCILLIVLLSFSAFAEDEAPVFAGIRETISGGTTYDAIMNMGMGGAVDEGVLSRYSSEDYGENPAATAGPYAYAPSGGGTGQNMTVDLFAEIRRHRKAYSALPEIKSEIGSIYKVDYQLFKAPSYSSYDNLRDLMKEKFFRE